MTVAVIGGLLESAGCVLGAWGVLWALWDRGNDFAGILVGVGIIVLLVGAKLA